MRHVPLRRPKADTKGRLKTGFPFFRRPLRFVRHHKSRNPPNRKFRLVSQGTGYFLVSVKPVQPNNSVSTRHR